MMNIYNWENIDYNAIPEDTIWCEETDVLKMHSIHSYPAKFPPFLASAAFNYAEAEGVKASYVSDVFCGCGTVALESKIRGKSFWGCDINPVATLISETKSKNYKIYRLRELYKMIIECAFRKKEEGNDYYPYARERLKHWYDDNQYNDLMCIYQSIIDDIPRGKYHDAFLCMFSAILKRTSCWLQKSIKPQVDPNKIRVDVFDEFEKRYNMFCNAVDEINMKKLNNDTCIHIVNKSLFAKINTFKSDLIITSPPYVTSYEYADLHQLSLLWLNYCDDYREMRRGTVGSSYNNNIDEKIRVNELAHNIVSAMKEKNLSRSKWLPVARYYHDMEKAVNICKDMLNKGGMSIFVIGDSIINGIKLENSRHLIEAMIETGYKDIKISKRKVSKGICIPYRDKTGQFTNQKVGSTEIYHEEYVISGRNYE